MAKSKFTRVWEHADSTLLWVELICVGDTKRMPEFFGFSYGGHYYISHNQNTVFYRNSIVENEAKEFGYKKYRNKKFIRLFLAQSKRSAGKLEKIINKISISNLKKLTPGQLYKLYDSFCDYYAGVAGVYRFCRPEFYERVILEIKEKLPEPRDKNLSFLLQNEFDKIDFNINGRMREAAIGLKMVGEERFALHKLWMRAYAVADKLFLAIGERIGLNSKEVQNCSREEIKNFLLLGEPIDKKKIADRIRGFKVTCYGNSFKIGIPGKHKNKQSQTSGLKGAAAFHGIVRGSVRVLRESLSGISARDKQRFLEGEILVTVMTAPDMVPLMKKASAIITDEGGMLCHAAIVSRELKKPCVIGTKIATKVLHDGDLVEVDAEKGAVKILKKAK